MQLSNDVILIAPETVKAEAKHLFWTCNPDESLMKSIKEFGQTTPILVSEKGGEYELVAGHARLAALKDMGLPVLARLVQEANELDKGLLYLADNEHRTVDDGMRLTALRYFASQVDNKTLKQDILPRLGVKPKSKDAKLLLGWMTMPENWQGHLAAGNVPLAAGSTLGRMDEADLNALEPLFSRFSWSRSNAVNTINWLFETSKMNNQSIESTIQNAGLNEILNQGLSPKDAIARLTVAAKAIRYPEISKLQDTFSKATSELTTGTRWRMNQPNNFETGGTELTIQVKDAKQLAAAVKDLEAMAGMSTWETLWKLGEQDD